MLTKSFYFKVLVIFFGVVFLQSCPVDVVINSGGLSFGDNGNDVNVTGTLTLSGNNTSAPIVSTDNSIILKLEWESNKNGATYDVYLGESNPPTTKVASGISTTSYLHQTTETVTTTDSSGNPMNQVKTINPLEPNTVYYWRVVMHDGDATVESSVNSFATDTGLSLLSPEDNEKDALTGAKKFTWLLLSDFTGYTFDFYIGKTNTLNTATKTGITASEYTHAITDFGATYYWKVIAKKSGETDVESVTRSFTVNKGVIAKYPSNNASDVAIGNGIDFTWDETSDISSANVDIYIGVTNPPTTKITTASVSAGTKHFLYTGTEFRFGITYYWQVKAVKTSGSATLTASSEVLKFTTVPGMTIVSPSNNATSISPRLNVEFDWSVTSDLNGATFDVYLGTNINPTTKVASGISATSFEYNQKDLSFNTTYYWKVVMKKGVLTQTSAVRRFTTGSSVTIEGYVSASKGGAAVGGATVKLQSADGSKTFETKTSDATTGKFQFTSDIGPVVIVATKSGRASSRLDTYVRTSGNPTYSMQLFPIEYSGWSTTPPVITYTGILPDTSISSTTAVTAGITASNPLLGTSRRPQLAVDVDAVGQSYMFTGSNKLSYLIDPTVLNRGVHFISFTGYDVNNNQGILIIPFQISGSSTVATLSSVPGSNSSTFTRIFSTTKGETSNVYSLTNDASTAVNILVKKYSANKGIMIYRGTTSSNLQQIGTSTSVWTCETNSDSEVCRSTLTDYDSITGDYFLFTDYLVGQKDDTKYIYKLKYIMSQPSVSDFGPAIEVPILPPVNLALDAPVYNMVYDGATTSAIDFKWTVTYPTTMVGTLTSSKVKRTDSLFIREVSTGQFLVASSVYTVNGATTGQVVANYSLDALKKLYPERGKRYLWTATSNLMYTNKETGKYDVVSVSYPTTSVSVYKGASQDGVLYFRLD